MSKITIIGGGNMGSVLAVKFSQKHSVTLFLNHPYEKVAEYAKDMVYFNEDSGSYFTGRIAEITDNLSAAVKNAAWIFVTYPPFLFPDLAEKLIPLLHKDQHLVGIPGSGGFELFFKAARDKGVTVTGLQRVHSVARITRRGAEAKESGVRGSLRCASIPAEFNQTAADFLAECYGMTVTPLDNYLNITLINSNPILHTSRLYTIFRAFREGKTYGSLPLFYEEWSLESSVLLEQMDAELFAIIDRLNKSGIPVKEITTLLEHYESTNAAELTSKLNSIHSLKGLKTPAITNPDGSYSPDFDSRYFTADFPFGLDILISFGFGLNVPVPKMLQVSDWYHKITKTARTFSLQSYGISTVADIKSFYL